MTRPKPPFDGACLCGAVQVRVTAPPLLTVACHCRDCQKFTASAYSVTTMFPHDSVTVSGALIKGGLHRPERAHFFCERCLNFIYSEIGTSGQRINLRTSVLHAAAEFEPYVEIMTDEKMPWSTTPAARSYRQGPQDVKELQALMEAYQSP